MPQKHSPDFEALRVAVSPIIENQWSAGKCKSEASCRQEPLGEHQAQRRGYGLPGCCLLVKSLLCPCGCVPATASVMSSCYSSSSWRCSSLFLLLLLKTCCVQTTLEISGMKSVALHPYTPDARKSRNLFTSVLSVWLKKRDSLWQDPSLLTIYLGTWTCRLCNMSQPQHAGRLLLGLDPIIERSLE